jgi:hypothetical protein
MAANAPNLVELQKLRLTMGKTIQEFAKQTAALEKALGAHADAALRNEVEKLRPAGLKGAHRLDDSLDKALNESDPRKRAALYSAAGKNARDVLKFINGDPRARQIDKNPISPVPARAALAKVPTAMTRLLP